MIFFFNDGDFFSMSSKKPKNDKLLVADSFT